MLLAALLVGCVAGGDQPDGGSPNVGSGSVAATASDGASAGAGDASSGQAGSAGAADPGGSQAGAAAGQNPAPAQTSGYCFKANGVVIQMGAPAAPVVDALYEPLNYFEAPSCAFDGVDRIYYYRGFELYTYPVDDVDFISSINLTDDSVETPEGVYLGLGLDEVIGAYGDGYEQNFGQYSYPLDDSSLSFLIEDGAITAITYHYTNMPEG